MTKILFLDESGDHNLIAIDPQNPIFVLGGIIVDEEYALGEMTKKVDKFKEEIFGTKNITLHTADFTRQKNDFERMKEKEFCEKFYLKLNNLNLEPFNNQPHKCQFNHCEGGLELSLVSSAAICGISLAKRMNLQPPNVLELPQNRFSLFFFTISIAPAYETSLDAATIALPNLSN